MENGATDAQLAEAARALWEAHGRDEEADESFDEIVTEVAAHLIPPTHCIVSRDDLKRLLEMVSDLPLVDGEADFLQRINRTLVQTS